MNVLIICNILLKFPLASLNSLDVAAFQRFYRLNYDRRRKKRKRKDGEGGARVGKMEEEGKKEEEGKEEEEGNSISLTLSFDLWPRVKINDDFKNNISLETSQAIFQSSNKFTMLDS